MINEAVNPMIDIILNGEYEYYGLRQLPEDQAIKIGETLKNSNHWNDGNYTDESCGGARAIEVCNGGEFEHCDASYITDAARRLGRNSCEILKIPFAGLHSYEGNTVVLCGSEEAEIGDDPDEIIMNDAKALYSVSKIGQ